MNTLWGLSNDAYWHFTVMFYIFPLPQYAPLDSFPISQNRILTQPSHPFMNPPSPPSPSPSHLPPPPPSSNVLQTPSDVLQTPSDVLQTPSDVLQTPSDVLQT